MYNKSKIFKNAWKYFNKGIYSFSKCLKMAWNNEKLIMSKLAEATKKYGEPLHTWYGWKLLGREVIHESKNVLQIVIDDITTRSHKKTLSYFTMSQTQIVE